MTVKDLIGKLAKLDWDAEVYLDTADDAESIRTSPAFNTYVNSISSFRYKKRSVVTLNTRLS